MCKSNLRRLPKDAVFCSQEFMHFSILWVEQCDATEEIQERYGLQAALDYLVGEKFLNHLHLAKVHKPLEEQIENFAQRIRGMFSPENLRQYLEKLEHPEKPNDPEDLQDEDFLWNNNPVKGWSLTKRHRKDLRLLWRKLKTTTCDPGSLACPRDCIHPSERPWPGSIVRCDPTRPGDTKKTNLLPESS